MANTFLMNTNVDSLWIEYYSLIISTIFYLIYLKFTYFAKKTKSNRNIHDEHTKNYNPNPDDLNNDNTVNTKTKMDLEYVQHLKSEKPTEINPNIDEMISSLNHKIQSISPNVPKLYSNNNEQFAKINNIHNNNTFHINDDQHDIDSDHDSNSSPSPHSKIIAPQHLIEAYNEILTISQISHSPNPFNSYYDTAEFDDENEYDSDTLNDYDDINNQLRKDIKATLYKIKSPTPKQRSGSSLFSFPSRTSSLTSLQSEDIIHAPNPIKDIIAELNSNENVDETVNITNKEDVSLLDKSQSGSPLNMHRYQFSGESQSGSDFDKYIQENDFLLNEEYSSSDLNHVNHINEDEDITHQVILDEDEEFENDLKNCDVDLSQFPTEQECYPLYTH